jgi:two-component system sensor histidine kinase/response regulator
MKSKDISILYIDDEEHNLQSFKASFRKEYKILTTTSTEEAESILDSQEICIILADQKMPVMTGVQFFEKIRVKHPEPIRILITGHTDIGAAIDAINKGEVFRFIDKPWDYGYVETAIDSAYDIFKTRADLKQRNIDLEKAYEELDKFVYSASHDLRAPLMSILGIVNLAQMEATDKENEYMTLIEQSVKKLDTFIISIIDYYKNARGVPEVSDINFEELVRDVKDAMQYFPGFEKINTTISIDQPCTFRSDIVKLRIIFNNLLSNAIKFQDIGKESHSIDLNIKVTPNEATIRLSDNGLGIKEANIDKIFKMFFRAGATNSGSGLGLYIVNEAVTKLRGNIKVRSELGKGSTFEISIPTISE